MMSDSDVADIIGRYNDVSSNNRGKSTIKNYSIYNDTNGGVNTNDNNSLDNR